MACTKAATVQGLEPISTWRDDVPVPPAGVEYDAANRIVRWHRAAPLAADRYTVRLLRNLAGVAGNRLTNDFIWGFEVRGPLRWTRDSDGLWSTVTNWSTGKVPDRDFVVIDRDYLTCPEAEIRRIEPLMTVVLRAALRRHVVRLCPPSTLMPLTNVTDSR